MPTHVPPHQFFYVFFCAGVYMLTDVVLKAVQGIGDMPLNKKAAFWSCVQGRAERPTSADTPVHVQHVHPHFVCRSTWPHPDRIHKTPRAPAKVSYRGQGRRVTADHASPTSSFGLITYVLPALAGLLLAESLIQSCINNARYWTSQVVKAANEKRQEMTKVRNVPRR